VRSCDLQQHWHKSQVCVPSATDNLWKSCINCLAGGHPTGIVLTRNCKKFLFTCHQSHRRKTNYNLSCFSVLYVAHKPTNLIKLYICKNTSVNVDKKTVHPSYVYRSTNQQICNQQLGTINKSGSNCIKSCHDTSRDWVSSLTGKYLWSSCGSEN